MLHVSDDWKAYTEDNHNFEIKAVLTLEDGTVFNLTGDDFMSACINDAVSEMDSITIGAVVTNRFSGSLNNMNDKFTGLDLEGATLELKVGLIYEDLSEEWLDKGIFILDQPSAMGDVLQISAYDYMDKMNRYYMGTHPVGGEQQQITFPIASKTLAQYLCDYCGVSYDPGFWNISNNLQVEEFEFNESTTCREVLSWVLQINCGYARISNLGKLEVRWLGGEGYWSESDDLDGGTIQPWAADDTADGGIMDPWAVVPDVEGGYICIAVDKVLSVEMSARDVRVTGIRAYAFNTVDEFDFSTAGTSGYILAIENNPLIHSDNTDAVANAVNNEINGLALRPYSAKIEANPCLEAGDSIALMDYKGDYHISFITNLTFNWGAAMSISAGAETVSKKDLEFSNPTTTVIQGAVSAVFDYITTKKLSADYIRGGTLELGGYNNTNGVMRLLDANNDQITLMDKDGILTTKLVATEGIYISSDRTSAFLKIPYYTNGGYLQLSQSGFLISMDSGARIQNTTVGSGDEYVGALENVYDNGTYLWDSTWSCHSFMLSQTPSGGGTRLRDVHMVPGNFYVTKGSVGAYLNAENGTYDFIGTTAKVTGNFSVTGTKNREFSTADYSDRLLYCYETPSPMFGDVGEGVIGEDGFCYVWLDPIFSETIDTIQYQVFLQKYGNGDCWVAERKGSCFVVEGTPDLAFGWEIKGKQADFTQKRLDREFDTKLPQQINYADEAIKYLNELREGRHTA